MRVDLCEIQLDEFFIPGSGLVYAFIFGSKMEHGLNFDIVMWWSRLWTMNSEHNQSYCDWWKQFILFTFFPFSFVCLCNHTWFLMDTLRSILFRTSVKFLVGLLKSACLFDRMMAKPLNGMIQQALISRMLVSAMWEVHLFLKERCEREVYFYNVHLHST